MKQFFHTLPLFGIFLFLALYLVAAHLYPGGTKSNPQTEGFSHFSNYWCDLLDEISYSGDVNPGRIFALGATFFLPISLISFWWNVTSLVPPTYRNTRQSIRVLSILSTIISMTVFTKFHDTTIITAFVLGFPAFIAVLWGIFKSGEILLFALSLLPLGFGLANFFMWQIGVGLEYLPSVQRFAFVSFFIWVYFANIKARRVSEFGK